MIHLKFLNLAMNLVDKASDGDLTLSEIAECLAGTFPEYSGDVAVAIEEAMEDGSISVWEVFKILTAVIT